MRLLAIRWELGESGVGEQLTRARSAKTLNISVSFCSWLSHQALVPTRVNPFVSHGYRSSIPAKNWVFDWIWNILPSTVAKGPPPAPIGTVGVGYIAVDDGVDETLVVDKATVDELFGVTVDDFDVIVELFAEVVDAFVVDVVVFVVDRTSCAAPFGAGAPMTRETCKRV